MAKTVDTDSYDEVGDVLTYTITVENQGNVTLTGVDVDDVAPGTGAFTLDCADLPATLAPQCERHVHGDVRRHPGRPRRRQRRQHGSRPRHGSRPARPWSPSTCPSPRPPSTSPSLTVLKTVDAAGYDEVGDVLTYTITVTNSGNVTVTGVSVSDPAPGAGAFNLDCSALPDVLAPDADGTCTATYAVTQADIDSGAVTNTATGERHLPIGPGQRRLTAGHHAGAVAGSRGGQDRRRRQLRRGRRRADLHDHRHQLRQRHRHRCLGQRPCSGCGRVQPGLLRPADVLAPDADGTCTATYAVTQADIDSGAVTNTATGNGTSPSGPVSDDSPPVTTPAEQSPALAVAKTVNTDSYDEVGDVLTYTITVENQGNVTLTGVDVDDVAPGTGAFTLDCAQLPATLPSSASGTCTATYAVTQADLDGGTVVNTARARATGPAGTSVESVDVSVTSTAETSRTLAVAKTVDDRHLRRGRRRTEVHDHRHATPATSPCVMSW